VYGAGHGTSHYDASLPDGRSAELHAIRHIALFQKSRHLKCPITTVEFAGDRDEANEITANQTDFYTTPLQ